MVFVFCTNCGQENKDGAKFCTSCGAPLGPVPQGPVQGQSAPGEPAEPTPVEQPIEPERPRRRIGAGAVAAIVLAVLLVLGGGTAGALYLLKVGPFAEGAPEAQDEPGEPEDAAGEDEPEASAGDEKGDKADEKGDEGDKGDKDAAGPAGTDAGIDSQGGRAGTVEVPSVVGMSQSEALQALSEAGLVSRIGGEEHSSKVAEGDVCVQSVEAGSEVASGSTVTLTLSLGPEMVTEHRYEFVRRCLTWSEARDYCEERGGYLATISSAEEFDRVRSVLPSEDVVACWVGAYRSDDSWAWVDGSEFSYSSWASGEPNNDEGNENYVGLLKVNGSWSWYDLPSDLTVAYDSNRIGFVMETEVQVPKQ